MEAVILADYKEIRDFIVEKGDPFKLCYQCGKCDTLCPWNRVTSFSMRRIIIQASFGLTEIEGEDIWRCTTCGRCTQQCPRGVNQTEVVKALREIATQYRVFPARAQPVSAVGANLATLGNPLGEKREKRADWAQGLSVKTFTKETEILYFPGCYLCYDARMRKVARATANILNAAGVDFGILGPQENCCGESIRKAGEEELFASLAKENIKTFIDNGVKKILVNSPHCYHTFKNEYPEFMVNFQVVHISQFLFELLSEGRLKFTKEYNKKVTYHDPCYLGRHNGIFDEPREVLRQVPGLEFIEMPESREKSLCCGGGGGGIWMETAKGERFSDLRLKQAIGVGAEILATCCPYCILNFEDSKLTLKDGEALEIKDLTEIVQEVI